MVQENKAGQCHNCLHCHGSLVKCFGGVVLVPQCEVLNDIMVVWSGECEEFKKGGSKRERGLCYGTKR